MKLVYFLIFLFCASFVSAQIATCGNGILEIGEECDDTNLNNFDSCSAECRLDDFDGDGVGDEFDNCPFHPGSNQDSDADGRGDVCDKVSNHAVHSNLNLWVQERNLKTPDSWILVSDMDTPDYLVLEFIRKDESPMIDFSKVTINVKETVLGGAAVEVKGLTLERDEEKTIRLNQKLFTGELCVSDSEDVRFEDMPVSVDDCVSPFILLNCLLTTENYSCSKKDDFWLVSGLKHSIVVELSDESAPYIPPVIVLEPLVVGNEVVVGDIYNTPVFEPAEEIIVNGELQGSDANAALTGVSVDSSRSSFSKGIFLLIALFTVIFAVLIVLWNKANHERD